MTILIVHMAMRAFSVAAWNPVTSPYFLGTLKMNHFWTGARRTKITQVQQKNMDKYKSQIISSIIFMNGV